MQEEVRLTERIRKLLQGKNQIYASIAAYLLQTTPEQLGACKVKDIEKQCHVSSATVIRFCKAVGMQGFSMCKYRLIDEKREDAKIYDADGTQIRTIADTYMQRIIQSLQRTRSLVQEKRFQQVFEAIRKAERICIYAAGPTFLVAQDFENKLERIQKHCKSYQDETRMCFDAKNADTSTLIVGISYSALSARVIENMRVAAQQGAQTLLITSEKNTSFEKSFDMVLYVSSSETRDRVMSTTSRMMLLYLVDLIYYGYLQSDIEGYTRILKHNHNKEAFE